MDRHLLSAKPGKRGRSRVGAKIAKGEGLKKKKKEVVEKAVGKGRLCALSEHVSQNEGRPKKKEGKKLSGLEEFWGRGRGEKGATFL